MCRKWMLLFMTSYISLNQENCKTLLIQNYQMPSETEAEIEASRDLGDFEVALYEALVKIGIEAECHFEVSGISINLAIKDPYQPHQFLLAVLLETDEFQGWKNMDLSKSQRLESLGWKVVYVSVLQWYLDPKVIIDAIVAKLYVTNSNPNCSERMVDKSSADLMSTLQDKDSCLLGSDQERTWFIKVDTCDSKTRTKRYAFSQI